MRKTVFLVACFCLSASMVTAKESETMLRAKALFEEGEKQYSLSRYEDALAAYEQAFLAKPLPGFLFNVGQCDRMLGKHKEAVRAYERFLEAAPNSPAEKTRGTVFTG